MTQGLFIRTDETGWVRPASKKAVKEAAKNPRNLKIEATSLFGNEHEGRVIDLLEVAPFDVTFVGPDPRTRRNFYGTLSVTRDGRIVVK